MREGKDLSLSDNMFFVQIFMVNGGDVKKYCMMWELQEKLSSLVAYK